MNDIVDLKLVKSGKIKPNVEIFNPLVILKFVMSLLQNQAQAQRIKLSLLTVTGYELGRCRTLAEMATLQHTDLPQRLLGDKLRF